jgi:hypothetical protein
VTVDHQEESEQMMTSLNISVSEQSSGDLEHEEQAQIVQDFADFLASVED